jgi:hypothetical protein
MIIFRGEEKAFESHDLGSPIGIAPDPEDHSANT